MYFYKTSNYDLLHNKWLAREPKLETFMTNDEVELLDDLGYWAEHFEDQYDLQLALIGKFARYEQACAHWRNMEPKILEETLEPGTIAFDIVRGPLTARKLLLHIECPVKTPIKPILDIIHSNYARHKHRGPYEHSLTINVYPLDIGFWDTNFHKQEVDLWHVLADRVLARLVVQMAEGARTPVQRQRIYRL